MHYFISASRRDADVTRQPVGGLLPMLNFVEVPE
jgi:hypothetical protein